MRANVAVVDFENIVYEQIDRPIGKIDVSVSRRWSVFEFFLDLVEFYICIFTGFEQRCGTVATVVDTVFFKYIRRSVFVGDNLADSQGFLGFHIPIYFYFPEIPGIVNTIYRRKSFEVYGYLFYTFGYKKRDYPNERDNLFSIW